MEYERIEKVQSSISPSKLRMKLMGPHHLRKKDGSNSNSSRTSPTRIEDSEFVNSLLASKNGHFDEQVKVSDDSMKDSSLNEQITSQSKESLPRESIEVGRAKSMRFPKNDNGISSSIHPMRTVEDENPDSDSNASSSSFEFHKGERALPASMARSYSRPMSSKWNDAEKWILSKQNVQAMNAKKNSFQSQAIRFPITDMVRDAPESANSDHRLLVNGVTDAKTVNFGHPAMQMLSRESREMVRTDLFCSKSSAEDKTVLPTIRSVCMRDMGTEMTPATSPEPSRTSTPAGAATPLRTPTSSVWSTSHRGTSTPLNHTMDSESHHRFDNGKRELSEQDMKLKTRREIVALGVQLGKMNIAAWASRDEKGKRASLVETDNVKELEQIEYEKRAAAWEEA
ncbi:Remorin family protein isoform 2 [Hibiscus syriacus]|uniref:Remorin family protein isoform 2 n=1 Tax=Hibiscus syriacus TaxID=106335 RepID=A0A6A3BTM5_HIBSY|nr:Remorin family protein isoform 2 [Hibiscus syriacus]